MIKAHSTKPFWRVFKEQFGKSHSLEVFLFFWGGDCRLYSFRYFSSEQYWLLLWRAQFKMKMQRLFFTKPHRKSHKVLKYKSLFFLPYIPPAQRHASLSRWTWLIKNISSKIKLLRLSRCWQHGAWVCGPVRVLTLTAFPSSQPWVRQ